MKNTLGIQVFLAAALSFCPFVSAATVSMKYDKNIPQLDFAAEKIQQAIDSTGHEWVKDTGQYRISLTIQQSDA